MNQVITFKRIIDSNEDLESYELFKTIRTNIDRVYSSFDFGNDTTPEGMAKKIASKIAEEHNSMKDFIATLEGVKFSKLQEKLNKT